MKESLIPPSRSPPTLTYQDGPFACTIHVATKLGCFDKLSLSNHLQHLLACSKVVLWNVVQIM